MHVKNNDITYFDSFGVEYIPKEIKAFIKNKNIKTNIFRIQGYGNSLTEYTNLFWPNDFKKNDDTILNYFMNNA